MGDSKTLAGQTAEKLLKMIKNKGLEPGDKLPTEKELCDELKVGRNTIREAMKLLASKNIITVRQGSGSFISEKCGVADDPFGFGMVRDREKLTKDLLQMRELIEPSIAALAAEDASEEEIAVLEGILMEMEAAMADREDYSSLDFMFHRKIAECTHNMVMEKVVPIIREGVAIFAEEVDHPDYEQTLLSHRRIFEAIKNRRPSEAEREMRFHLLYNDNRYRNR